MGLTDTQSSQVARTFDAQRRKFKVPAPPRGVRFVNGLVTWDASTDELLQNVTDYRIYTNSETNLFEQVPVSQHSSGDVVGSRVFVSSFNSISQLESYKVLLNQAVGLGSPNLLQNSIDLSNLDSSVTGLLSGSYSIQPTASLSGVSLGAPSGSTILSYTGAGAILGLAFYTVGGTGTGAQVDVTVTVDGAAPQAIKLMAGSKAFGADVTALSVGNPATTAGDGQVSLPVGFSFKTSILITLNVTSNTGYTGTMNSYCMWSKKL